MLAERRCSREVAPDEGLIDDDDLRRVGRIALREFAAEQRRGSQRAEVLRRNPVEVRFGVFIRLRGVALDPDTAIPAASAQWLEQRIARRLHSGYRIQPLEDARLRRF